MRRQPRPAYTLVAAALLLAGCDDKAEPKGAKEAKPSSSAAQPVVSPSEALAGVCDGKPVKTAAKYDKKAGTVSPVRIFFRDDDKAKFQSKVSTVFNPWGMLGDPEETQLVACVSVGKRKKVRECSFNRLTKSQKKGKRWVDQYDAELVISVREAATGKELASETVERPAPARCPQLFNFEKDREAEYPRFEPTLLTLLAPLQPDDVVAPNITRDDLTMACEGKPVPGTKPYVEGAESSTRVFWREADKPWVPSMLFSGESWHTSEVTDTRLAACVHAKPGKKAGECSFQGAKKLELLDTAYTVRIVELATGKTLGERTVEAKSQRCPSFWDFNDGSRRFAYMGNDTKSWIAAFATGKR